MISNDILIIKVGTSTLTNSTSDGSIQLDVATFKRIADEAAALQAAGHRIIIVSSAAITAGMSYLSIQERPSRQDNMPELQRMASIGWRIILNTWDEAFQSHTIGELLITKQELDQTQQRTELVQVVHQLLLHENICVVNENDAISHEEIAFGDNDTLAAHLAARLQQSELFSGTVRLIILSDIEGVYADKDDPSTLLPIIPDITAVEASAKDSTSPYGTGGMTTKFLAAKIAHSAHVETWIGKGKKEQVLPQLLNGKTGTHFTVEK
jgi:glutamate 5-kinase